MITPAYSATATERVLPRMALDFTTASLDARVTVTRALDTATRVNSSGYIENVNANLPRFDYDPQTLVCKGLLIEESRANLILNSSTFSAASWETATLSVSSDTIVSPDGTTNADALTGTVANSFLKQSVNCSANTAYTRSIWLKVPSGTLSVNIYATDTGTGFAVLSASLTTSWQRFTISATSSATATQAILQVGGGNTWGNGVVIHAWGAQLEAGAFATSYIPTTTTSLTRNADAVSMTGTNFSDWYTATAGTIVVDAAPQNIFGIYQFSICGAGNTGNDALYSFISTNYLVQCFNAGNLQANINTGVVGGTAVRVAAAYASNNFGAVANAGTVGTDATYSQPTADKLRIGSSPNNTITGVQHVRKVAFYPQRLTNAEIQAFSK